MDDQQKLTVQAIVNVFETGHVTGNYGAVTVLKGDNGHLTYGRSQTTLGSGNLYKLLLSYCQQSGASAAVVSQLQPALPRFQQKDFSLDTDVAMKSLLKLAGDDPVMRAAQDQFFNENYFIPALRAADAAGITEPLGHAAVYDSHIQGGWPIISARIGSINSLGGERGWIGKYIDTRREWLLSLKPPLPSTVYRMDSFKSLIDATKWKLDLPLAVHGVTITAEALAGSTPAPGAGSRNLRLTTPYLRGDDVKAVQAKLGISTLDGIYGPFTDMMVKQFQLRRAPAITENGVGPATRAALGL